MENESFPMSQCDCWIQPCLKPAPALDFPVTLVAALLLSLVSSSWMVISACSQGVLAD